MKHVTYSELAMLHGHDQASDLLSLIERLARTRDEITFIDKDQRFKKALEALNEVNFGV